MALLELEDERVFGGKGEGPARVGVEEDLRGVSVEGGRKLEGRLREDELAGESGEGVVAG